VASATPRPVLRMGVSSGAEQRGETTQRTLVEISVAAWITAETTGASVKVTLIDKAAVFIPSFPCSITGTSLAGSIHLPSLPDKSS